MLKKILLRFIMHPFPKRPNRLFMYFRVENAKLFLANHNIKFTNLTLANDPFELAIDYRQSMYDTNYKAYDGKDEEPADEDIIKLRSEVIPKLSNHGVACFTETDTNVLMWAYYAGSQKGICFEFDTNEDPIFFQELHKVQYKNHFESIKEKGGMLDCLDIFTTKSIEWQHEREWRVIKDNKAGLLFPINPKSIKSVIFGYGYMDYRNVDKQTLQTYKDIITLLQRPEYRHIQLKQIQRDMKQYKLEAKEVPFLLFEEDNQIVVVSFLNQRAVIEDINHHIVYTADMIKWEYLYITLPIGDYYVHNSECPSNQIRLTKFN